MSTNISAKGFAKTYKERNSVCENCHHHEHSGTKCNVCDCGERVLTKSNVIIGTFNKTDDKKELKKAA